MKQIACKLCGAPFVCDNGMWRTTCTCAKDRPEELKAAQANMDGETRSKSRVSWLQVPEFFRLDVACRPLFDAFGTPPYLVGSCMSNPDFRDVDVSLMLSDEKFDAMFTNK